MENIGKFGNRQSIRQLKVFPRKHFKMHVIRRTLTKSAMCRVILLFAL